MGKILFLSANPDDTSRIAIDKEIRDIKEGIERSKKEAYELIVETAIRTADIRRSILQTKPDIVHFSGHGSRTGVLFIEGKNENGRFKIKPDALGAFLSIFREDIKCVVLNACYTEKQATAIVQSIPYVIGTNSAIHDAIARQFSIAFYEALSEGMSIPRSFIFSNRALSLENQIAPIFMKINQLEQNRLAKEGRLTDIISQIEHTETVLGQHKVDLEVTENDFLEDCPFPYITKYLKDNKAIIAKKVEEELIETGDDLDRACFRGEFRRHLELVILSLLIDDQEPLIEPDLVRSYKKELYIQGLQFVLNRIPIGRFSNIALQRVKDDINYLINRL